MEEEGTHVKPLEGEGDPSHRSQEKKKTEHPFPKKKIKAGKQQFKKKLKDANKISTRPGKERGGNQTNLPTNF